MQVIALSEGAFTIDKTKKFVPFNLNTDQLDQRPIGSLLVEIQPFIVITKKDIILIDSGLGFSNDQGILNIYENMRTHGIEPELITKVLISHLHKDHAGGLSSLENNGGGTLNFKNATYYISKDEVEFALQNNSPSYDPSYASILKNSSKVVLLDNAGMIDNYIQYEKTGGHSIHHQVFWIREDGETIFYGGDVAPQLQQMKSRFVAKYDFDGKKSMELRRIWQEIGSKEKWKFLFYHDIKNPIFQS